MNIKSTNQFHIAHLFSVNIAIYEVMGKKIYRTGRQTVDDSVILHRIYVLCMQDNRHTLIILNCFPWKQWLNEGHLMLRYT